MLSGFLLLTGAYPFWQLWRANRHTSLHEAVIWALVAWFGWGVAVTAPVLWVAASADALRYLALCLTACAGVAVLGARRPGVSAWNFVVLGLLAVLLLPLLQIQGLDSLRHNPPQAVFLAATLAIGILNYLPTRLTAAALLLASGCMVEVLCLAVSEAARATLAQAAPFAHVLVALSPWAALFGLRGRGQPRAEFDRVWLAFRDRFGLLWSQRLREQFNRSAANAGWPVVLRWRGLRLIPGSSLPAAAVQEEIVATLKALLKRFGTE